MEKDDKGSTLIRIGVNGWISFWYRPTRVVPDQRPLNGRCCCKRSSTWCVHHCTHCEDSSVSFTECRNCLLSTLYTLVYTLYLNIHIKWVIATWQLMTVCKLQAQSAANMIALVAPLVQSQQSQMGSYLCLHTHMFNGPFSGTTWVSRYQKGKTNLDFTEARDSEWQWHQLGHMQICTSLQTDNHISTPPLSFLQAGCPSCRPANRSMYAGNKSYFTNNKLLSWQTK